jgi:glyceraldehyde 3-phosphate dehydrogenase
MSAAGGLLRIFGWYDNEWGFANRMLEMALLVGNRNLERMPFPSKRRART